MTTLLRDLLANGRAVHAPGVYDVVSARLAEQAGFDVIYLSGAVTSAVELGIPDLGYVNGGDIAGLASRIAAVTDLPLICDADTGYGNALHARRTVEQYARAGVAGLHIEDQAFPKRCGHMADKAVVPIDEAVGKVRAAVDVAADLGTVIIARTDAWSVEGVDGALRRAQAYAEAGADLVFVEGAATTERLAQVHAVVPDAPLVLNRSEADPRMSAVPDDVLAAYGVRLVIHPVSAMLAAARAAKRTYAAIKQQGIADGVDRMTWDQLTDLVGQPEHLELEQEYGVDDAGAAKRSRGDHDRGHRQ